MNRLIIWLIVGIFILSLAGLVAAGERAQPKGHAPQMKKKDSVEVMPDPLPDPAQKRKKGDDVKALPQPLPNPDALPDPLPDPARKHKKPGDKVKALPQPLPGPEKQSGNR